MPPPLHLHAATNAIGTFSDRISIRENLPHSILPFRVLYYVANANNPDASQPSAYLDWLDGNIAYEQFSTSSAAAAGNYFLSCHFSNSTSTASGTAASCSFPGSDFDKLGFCINLGNHGLGYNSSL